MAQVVPKYLNGEDTGALPGYTYYFDMEPGKHQRMFHPVGQHHMSNYVIVQQSKQYKIHIAYGEYITVVCVENRSVAPANRYPAFVIVKCFDTTESTEYVWQGEEFNLVVLPDHKIKVLTDSSDLALPEIVKVNPGEPKSYQFELGKCIMFEYNRHTQFSEEWQLSMVHIKVDGDIPEISEYEHRLGPSTRSVAVKTGHTYKIRVRSSSQTYICNETDRDANKPFIVNVEANRKYTIYLQPNDSYILVGNKGPRTSQTSVGDDETVEEIATVIVKGIHQREVKKLDLNRIKEIRLFATAHNYFIVENEPPENPISRQRVRFTPGYNLKLELDRRNIYEISANHRNPDSGQILNAALLHLSYK